MEESNLLNYIESKKKEGFKICAVEQTQNSYSLTTFEFPKKCFLLLGQEQQGIPSEFLKAVDCCIEIPQLGITRSLNVHVSASIVIWEYTQQVLLKKSSLMNST